MKNLSITILLLFSIALLTQGFQCKSSDMTTANMSYNKKEFNKAIQFYKKELQKHPNNGEAWLKLSVSYLGLKEANVEEAINSALEAEKHLKDEKLLALLDIQKGALATGAYNKGISELRVFVEDADQTGMLDNAIASFETALKFKQNIPSFYQYYGLALENKGDKDKALKAYDKYMQLISDDIAFASAKGLYLNMPVEKIEKILGQPIDQKPFETKGADNFNTLVYKIENKLLFVYTTDFGKSGNYKITGWDYNPPRGLSTAELVRPKDLSIEPMAAIAEIYIAREDYSKAQEYIEKITKIDPYNQDAGNALISMFTRMGKKDEALDMLKSMIEKHPDNPAYLVNYGNTLAEDKQYDKAIEMYDKALEINPNEAIALRNKAACYKNQVADIQEKQEMLETTKNVPRNPDEYVPLLNMASMTYEKSLRTDEFKKSLLDRYQILISLADIYYVTEKEYELMTVVKKLQLIEKDPKFASLSIDAKKDYYLKLVKVYDRGDREYESKEFFSKFPELRDKAMEKYSSL